ncbi:MAG: patatin-like phospholipase family protein [Roseibium album]|uniref:Patatin-like phospholipase n=1 Tax=Roseibium album TaxID=311410 RepID=A0A0M6ZXA5_9HYPH|nr:patatin-like phospholipase family protein [Roseibium album]MBG6144123.1 NTE family protein [Labrenzia sp. EL_142]MBG6162836.1 NTE family protein [Labrenzia sp. EL_195]MBG6174770.1 NTE family protein [Labrenzia sp. EL_132]MBG6201629.1 NTE family protein [Labrenzia sp. EL_13]MBG6228948.1 NTE family protein [Labrenzia sp. EL_208]MCR9060237.1 patatin-like phospholipase family protein [Paracoccaceae bacterium]
MAEPKKINLALQGGGAHGAFTWGVLDWFLQDSRLSIDAITGTSAGAMNAVVLASGMEAGGEEGARASLEAFWREVSEEARFSPIQRTPLDVLLGNWSLDHSPSYLFFDVVSRFASPYEFNPLNVNPLRDVVEKMVDFDKVHCCSGVRLFIAATNVFSGKIRVFSEKEVTLDAVMASACLPQLYQAVEIDGEPYWDGGYMGNPPLYPLFYETATPDVVLVQINPLERRQVPRTAREIVNRLNEITFNSTLLRELRAIDFVTRLIEEGKLSSEEYMKVHMHRIFARELKPLQASSKLNAEWAFLIELRDLGRQTAKEWLDNHYDDIGERSSVDLRDEFA